jgi:hypothetical protein
MPVVIKRGTDGPDTLNGTAAADTLFGRGGDDRLLPGNDRMSIGAGFSVFAHRVSHWAGSWQVSLLAYSIFAVRQDMSAVES